MHDIPSTTEPIKVWLEPAETAEARRLERVAFDVIRAILLMSDQGAQSHVCGPPGGVSVPIAACEVVAYRYAADYSAYRWPRVYLDCWAEYLTLLGPLGSPQFDRVRYHKALEAAVLVRAGRAHWPAAARSLLIASFAVRRWSAWQRVRPPPRPASESLPTLSLRPRMQALAQALYLHNADDASRWGLPVATGTPAVYRLVARTIQVLPHLATLNDRLDPETIRPVGRALLASLQLLGGGLHAVRPDRQLAHALEAHAAALDRVPVQ
jgi:hypothetical protein